MKDIVRIAVLAAIGLYVGRMAVSPLIAAVDSVSAVLTVKGS